MASFPIYWFNPLQYSFRFPSVCNSRRSVRWAIGSLWWYHSNFSEELHLQRYGNAGSEKGVWDNFKCCTFCYIELIGKKITPKSNFLYLRSNTSFFLAHVTKYQIYYLLYFSLLDQEKLWQTFTTDKYICVIWRENEHSIIEVCNKIQKLRKSLSFFISCTISRKNWPNIFIVFFRFLFKLVKYLN